MTKAIALAPPDERPALEIMLRALKLPTFVQAHAEVADKAQSEGWTLTAYLRHLVEMETHDRERRRIERNLKESCLPSDKTLGTLDIDKLPKKVRTQLPALCEGGFVERAENLLAFGLPGRGKTHTICAIGHELVQRGHRVLFRPAFKLVQGLLAAKKDLALDQHLRKLDNFDAVVIDDIGYVQQSQEEMEVLFTFLSERYERRSVVITSNLVFSEWDRIFKNPMTTAAAIDRLVHHCVILEMTGPTRRGEDAQDRRRREKEANGDDNEENGKETGHAK
jgi:DNA replication protein DnaC